MKKKKEYQLLQGNAACAYGALAAGANFFAGYPITPSTEIAEILAKELPKKGGGFIQMEDEIGGICAILGASMAGSKAITATSGPGFSLMQEAIGYGSMTEIPCVIVNVMRGGPSTGLPTRPSQGDIMQAKYGTHGDHPIIALYPHSVREVFDLTVRAFNLSERYRVPTILLMDEVIGHMRESVCLPEKENIEVINRMKPTVPSDWYKPYAFTSTDIPSMAIIGSGYRCHITGLAHDDKGFPTSKNNEIVEGYKRLFRKIHRNKRDIIAWESFELEDAKICLVACGSAARTAKEAVRIARKKGIKVGLFRPITIWPFPKYVLRQILKKIKTVIVGEMNMGQLVNEVQRINRDDARIEKLNRIDGELITPDDFLKLIQELC